MWRFDELRKSVQDGFQEFATEAVKEVRRSPPCGACQGGIPLAKEGIRRTNRGPAPPAELEAR